MKQIVGSTLSDSKDGDMSLITNFESDKSAAEYASLYKEDGLRGGHVIMLGADPLSNSAAMEALHAYPGNVDSIICSLFSGSLLSYICFFMHLLCIHAFRGDVPPESRQCTTFLLKSKKW